MPGLPIEDQWLAATLRNIGEAIIAAGSDSHIVWMNQAAETLTGCSLEEARNRPLVEILVLYDEASGLPAVSPVYVVCESGAERSTGSYVLRRPGMPERPLEVSCFRNTAGDSRGAVLICRDLTAIRERASLQVRAERLDAIANFAGGMAHDLNNHLTVIQGYAEELRRLPGDGDRTPVQEISQAALAAAAMTRNLMSIARRSNNHPEVLVLSELVGEMSGALSRLLGTTRTLRVIADPDNAKVQADRTLLKQMLSSLALFAATTSRRGGEFTIETGSTEVLRGDQVPGWNRVGPYARLLVTDTGGSVDPNTVARIFEPACASRPVGFAHGIGMAQAHGIVSQSGGFMHTVSASDGKLVFEILLPRVYQFSGSKAESAPSLPQGDDTRLTVLLVEDDDSVRRIVHNYMERAGFNLLEAANAEEASDLAEVYEDPIHVLVTDVVLPGMSGRELADKLKSVRPELRVLLVSGFPRNTLVHTGAASGHRFLPKPFTANKLLESVRSLVREEVEPAQIV